MATVLPFNVMLLGAASRNRTGDLLLTMETLCQLSYGGNAKRPGLYSVWRRSPGPGRTGDLTRAGQLREMGSNQRSPDQNRESCQLDDPGLWSR